MIAKRTLIVAVCMLSLGFLSFAAPAAAQDQGTVEVGVSLVNLSILSPSGGGSSEVLFGVPSGSFGLIAPSLYAALPLSPQISIEPQVGFIVVSRNGQSNHVVSVAGQLDCFLSEERGPAPYVFGSVGVVDVSGGGTSPKSVSGGIGYRMPAGGRLVFRLDGRYTHFTDNGGNAISFTLSLGGIFGR
jgi:hypothetical protein